MDLLHESDDICFICKLEGELLLCDNCPSVFHLKCLGMKCMPCDNEKWFCPNCTTTLSFDSNKGNSQSDNTVNIHSSNGSSSGSSNGSNSGSNNSNNHKDSQTNNKKRKRNIENNKTYPPCYSFDTAEGIITSTPEVLSFAHFVWITSDVLKMKQPFRLKHLENGIIDPLNKNSQYNSLLIEGGNKLIASAINSSHLNKIFWFSSEKIIGEEGKPSIGKLNITNLDDSPNLCLQNMFYLA